MFGGGDKGGWSSLSLVTSSLESNAMLCHIIIHAMSHHHTCYVTSSSLESNAMREREQEREREERREERGEREERERERERREKRMKGETIHSPPLPLSRTQVTQEEAEEFASSVGAVAVETSAKANKGVEEIFGAVAKGVS